MRVINVTPNYQYIYQDGKVVKKELSKEKGIITSFIHPREILSITKKFDIHLSKEEIYLEMEKYIYTFPGVDINKDYKTIFLEIQRENFLILEALLVEVDDLNKFFDPILKVYKYIDFISPSFLAWEEFYKITKIEPKNDIFIYFSKDEAFLCGFSNGKYLFHKSLSKISTLAKLLGKEIDEVIDLLINKGLDVSKYDNIEEYNIVEKFFSEFFLKVFNLINFSSNEYQVPKFDRIFFYSPFEINSLFNQYENYWTLNGIEFKRSFLNTEYDHLEYLITIFNAKNYNKEFLNLSIFIKPPSIFTTKFGKFLIVLFLVLFFIIGYIGYKFYYIKSEENKIMILQKRYLMIKKRHNLEVKLVNKYKKENLQLLNKIKNIQKEIEIIDSKIDILYKNAKKPLFFNIFAKISESMKKYNLISNSISKKNNHIIIILISDYDNTQEVTSFMRDLINFKFKNVSVTTIANEKNKYISKVEFDYE